MARTSCSPASCWISAVSLKSSCRRDYRQRRVKPDNTAEFEELITRASSVRTLPFEQSNRDAYVAASQAVLSSVERMVAVWDGQPADGHGGTGDVVAAAHARALPVTVVWPDGAVRR